MRRWLSIVALWACCMPSAVEAAIVNTLRGFDADELGWSGSLEATASVTGGNTDLRKLGAGARVQWQNEQDRVRMLGSAQSTRGSTQKFEESELLHLRHNHDLWPKVESLLFLQWQRNPFQRLRSRYLAGVGARFDLARTSTTEVAIGASHMVEVERIVDESGHETNQRLSTFLALHCRLREGVDLDATAFGQPDWTDFQDVRAVVQGALRVELVAGLSLVVGGQWQYDSRPPAGVGRDDWTYDTAVAYDF